MRKTSKPKGNFHQEMTEAHEKCTYITTLPFLQTSYCVTWNARWSLPCGTGFDSKHSLWRFAAQVRNIHEKLLENKRLRKVRTEGFVVMQNHGDYYLIITPCLFVKMMVNATWICRSHENEEEGRRLSQLLKEIGQSKSDFDLALPELEGKPSLGEGSLRKRQSPRTFSLISLIEESGPSMDPSQASLSPLHHVPITMGVLR